jgi:hypothetical protein
MLDRTVFYNDRFTAKRRRGFRWKQRPQNRERLRSERNENRYDHCCTFHFRALLSEFNSMTSKILT